MFSQGGISLESTVTTNWAIYYVIWLRVPSGTTSFGCHDRLWLGWDSAALPYGADNGMDKQVANQEILEPAVSYSRPLISVGVVFGSVHCSGDFLTLDDNYGEKQLLKGGCDRDHYLRLKFTYSDMSRTCRASLLIDDSVKCAWMWLLRQDKRQPCCFATTSGEKGFPLYRPLKTWWASTGVANIRPKSGMVETRHDTALWWCLQSQG